MKPSELALMISAQIYQTEKNKNKVLDPDICEAVAEVIDKLLKIRNCPPDQLAARIKSNFGIDLEKDLGITKMEKGA